MSPMHMALAFNLASCIQIERPIPEAPPVTANTLFAIDAMMWRRVERVCSFGNCRVELEILALDELPLHPKMALVEGTRKGSTISRCYRTRGAELQPLL